MKIVGMKLKQGNKKSGDTKKMYQPDFHHNIIMNSVNYF